MRTRRPCSPRAAEPGADRARGRGQQKETAAHWQRRAREEVTPPWQMDCKEEPWAKGASALAELEAEERARSGGATSE